MKIYSVANKQNGKIYVGKTTKSLQHRKMRHYKSAKHNKKKTIFEKALLKYKDTDFEWKIIENCEESYLNLAEEWWIKKLDTYFLEGHGYNMTFGGDGNPMKVGDPRWKELKQKLSVAQNKRYRKQEERDKTGIYSKRMWRELSEEKKKNRANKISKTKGYNWLIITPNGKEFEINSLTRFCKENNLIQGNMWKVSAGERKHHRGYRCKKL